MQEEVVVKDASAYGAQKQGLTSFFTVAKD